MKNLFTNQKIVTVSFLVFIVVSIGLYQINDNIEERNSLLKQQMQLQQEQIDASSAATAQQSLDTQKQINATRYNLIRTECVTEEKQIQQDLNNFLKTCTLPSADDCLESPVGKLFVNALGQDAIQKCIDRNL